MFGHVMSDKVYVTCYPTCYMPLLVSWEVMGAIHDKVKKNRAKWKLKVKYYNNIFVLIALTIMDGQM
jgi:hypothetical protein